MQTSIPLTSHLFRVTHDVGISAAALREALVSAAELMAGVALSRFLFTETATNVYDYRIWLTDSRQWRQVVTFAGPADFNPDMTFTVNPGWRLDEFSCQRNWRTTCISLRNSVQASVIRLDPN